MKIYRARSAFNEKGNFIYKQVSQKEGCYPELKKQLNEGIPLTMTWAWGCKSKKLADYIPSTSPGLLFSNRVIEKMQAFFKNAKRYRVVLDDGQTFSGIIENNYPMEKPGMDHVFFVYPKHNYSVVSEEFKKEWEKNCFTGMTFEELGEMDDSLFLKV